VIAQLRIEFLRRQQGNLQPEAFSEKRYLRSGSGKATEAFNGH
jgi:hypothetical protein